ncbi:MAG: hypothetical protein WD079_04345 [Phycisphaeraceae bacterium]
MQLMLLTIALATAVGCGGGSENQSLWESAEAGYQRYESAPEGYDVHQLIAGDLDTGLSMHPEADADLRRFFTRLRDEERQLAEGDVDGAEAEALRAKLAEHREYLQRQELPPAF